MTELLFEIFCEEIPARMQAKAGRDLEKALVDGLTKAGLDVSGAHHWAGPRRLGFTADIPMRSPDVVEERKGPRVGSPEQALAGFLRGAGLTDISQADIREDKKGEHYVAVIEQPGQESADIIIALIPEIMNNFPWPKSMTSGGSKFRWVRPLQSMICLLGGSVVPVHAGGMTAGNVTEGHRRHGRGPFEVTSYADYKKTLETKGHVLLEASERKSKILADAKTACEAAELELVEDEGLLNEVAGLAEWPVVILGDMDPAFLQLPGEVIRLSMRTHQKYFAVRHPDGSLAPNFIVVANQAAPDGGKAIAAGNSRVLSARLDDARFFQSEDAKKNLIDYYEKLDTVVFHKKLGSIKDKAERVAALARLLGHKVRADPETAEQAAKLAKCDLVTQTVIEFTSLQGQIGRLMYERENGLAPAPSDRFAASSPTSGGADKPSTALAGEVASAAQPQETEGAARSAVAHAQSIAIAIEDHYKPQGPSDSVPTNPVAVAVALADKLDTLVSFWAIDEKPTGSKDPFALRRAALGFVRIILENDVRLNFRTYSVLALLILKLREVNKESQRLDQGEHSHRDDARLRQELNTKIENYRDLTKKCLEENEVPPEYVPISDDILIFIFDRVKVYLRDKGFRHDLIDAVFALGEDDLVAIVNRVQALQAFLSTSDGENLLAGYKRAANILKAESKKEAPPDGESGKGSQLEETALYDALVVAKADIDAALAAESYSEAMTALSKLRGPIDAFFEHVTVNDDDPKKRENRLLLLVSIRDTARRIADFDKVDG